MPARSRSSLLAVGLLLVVFAVGAIVTASLILGRPVPMVGAGGRIAVVPLNGVIGTGQGTVRALERFRRDGSVRAFVLEVRSPGGSVGGSQSLYRELDSLRHEDDRPIYAWIGDVGASGAYYAALGADSIFALPGSITGSIGVIMEFPEFDRLMDRAGVRLEVVKSGEHKDMGSPARKLTESDRAILQQVVDDTYAQFVDAVASNRHLPRDTVKALADGRIFSGVRARDLGLIDGIASFSEVLARAGRAAGLGEHPATVRPNERRIGILDLLRGVTQTRLEGWLASWTGWTGFGGGGAPRLLYQWR